jgi:hypothetical protein
MSAPSSPSQLTKCGFCCVHGHNINSCDHPHIIELMEMLDTVVNTTIPGGDASPVHSFLQSLPKNHLKMVALKHSIVTSASKATLISKIMDYHFYAHPDPVWRSALPSVEVRLQRFQAKTMRIRIMILQDRLNLNDPIPMRQLARMGLPQLNELYEIFEQEVALLPSDNHAYNYANNPGLVDRKFRIATKLTVVPENADQYATVECAICLENVTTHHVVKLNCNHEFCGECITETLKSVQANKAPSCALCRGTMKTFEIHAPQTFQMIKPLIQQQTV